MQLIFIVWSLPEFMKNILIKVSILIISFLILDLLFGNLFFNIHSKNSVYEQNNQFLYNFKRNLNIKNYNYGNLNYPLCTNNLGAIDNCNKEITNRKEIDYVFIGDSFVEGLGIEFNNTFFGHLKKKHLNKQFLNLGVSGYSSSIYYKKLKYFYNIGYKFSEIYIFLDTSDIFDEIYRYKLDPKDQISFNLTNDEINNLLDDKKKLIKNIHNKLPATFFLINLIFNKLPTFSFLQNYHLDLMVNHTFGKWSYGQSDLYSKEKIEESLKNNSKYVEKIIKMANENNTKITFVLYPWPGHLFEGNINNKYNSYWTNFLKNKDVHLINLNSHFFNFLKDSTSREIILKYYILGDVHFNLEGHKLIFQIIDKTISKN
jgi:hypothetical protein